MTRPSSISTPLRRSSVVRIRRTVPSTTPMARATSSVRWVSVSMPSRCEEDDVVAPLPHDLGVADRVGCRADDAERLVADLVAVAVRAVQHVAGPAFTQAGDVGELVAQPGGERAPAGW